MPRERTRGRPRTFDEDEVLHGAMLLFWEKGLSATSLDDLSTAMKMNRPSIYNAFGNKDDIYRKALDRFCGQLDQGMADTIDAMPDLRKGFQAFYDRAIDVYCESTPGKGCLMLCTAPSEAFTHPQVGEDLRALIQRLDKGFAKRLRRAQKEDALPAEVKAELTASLLQGTLHTIALRARAGSSKQELKKIARYAVQQLLP